MKNKSIVNYTHVLIPFLVLVFWLLPAPLVHAKGLYVRDWITISVRSAPNANSRIIGLANTNDYMEVLEEQTDWVKVKTSDGKIGWVQTRYLTDKTPKTFIIDQLNEKVNTQSEKIRGLLKENKQLRKTNQGLQYKVSVLTNQVKKLNQAYDDLKNSSSKYLELKSAYDKVLNEQKLKAEEFNRLKSEYKKLKTSDRLIFTLIGGTFIIIGLIIGIVLQSLRMKQRKAGYKF